MVATRRRSTRGVVGNPIPRGGPAHKTAAVSLHRQTPRPLVDARIAPMKPRHRRAATHREMRRFSSFRMPKSLIKIGLQEQSTLWKARGAIQGTFQVTVAVFRPRKRKRVLAVICQNHFQIKDFDRAEGMGFEPTTHCWASDFESDRWPIRLPSKRVDNVSGLIGSGKKGRQSRHRVQHRHHCDCRQRRFSARSDHTKDGRDGCCASPQRVAKGKMLAMLALWRSICTW